MVPDYLKDVYPVDATDAETLSVCLSNYVKWSKFKDRMIITERDAKKALVLEILGAHRPLMIERIKHRFNILRHKREMNELYTCELFREAYRAKAEKPVRAEGVAVPKVRQPRKSRST